MFGQDLVETILILWSIALLLWTAGLFLWSIESRKRQAGFYLEQMRWLERFERAGKSPTRFNPNGE